MRKIFFSILAVAGSFTLLHAEGYQLNLNSVKQAGMGNTGVALKLGAESMIYNPAGLSFMNGGLDLSAGLTAIRSHVKYTNGSYQAETDNPLGTPLFVYAGFKITRNLAAGVSLNNPAGNSIYWPDDWNGATIVQNSSLQAFCLQPSLSFKFLDDKLSVGAGAMIMWGNFSNSKALMPKNPAFGDVYPVSAKLYGDAKINYGFNLGLLFAPVPQLSIGLSYRSKVDLKVDEGHTDFNFASPQIEQAIIGALPPLYNSLFSASMPIPSNINFGVSYQPGETFLITAELQRVGWGVFDELVITYDEKIPQAMQPAPVPKKFTNTMIYRIGGQWTAYPKFDVRLGFYYDETPVCKDLYYSPETPGSSKTAFTCGYSWRAFTGFSLDFAFTYSRGPKTTGYFTAAPYSASAPFTGDYKVHAFLPALGLSYTF